MASKLASSPAVSRMAPALAARATLNEPTAVSAAVSVALLPDVETALRVPPLGTFVSVHGSERADAVPVPLAVK